MTNFNDLMKAPINLSDIDQKKAGQAISGDMGQEYKVFVENVSKMLESGEIDVTRPETFLNSSIYEKLEPEWKSKTDTIIINMAILLTHIHGFYRSKQTPDACPQLETMIKQLWEMKQRIEVHADVFKF